jgi:hypothetical protein
MSLKTWIWAGVDRAPSAARAAPPGMMWLSRNVRRVTPMRTMTAWKMRRMV